MEIEDKVNCSIMDGIKLLNENDYGYVVVIYLDVLFGLLEDSKKVMFCFSSEFECVIFIKFKLKGKWYC